MHLTRRGFTAGLAGLTFATAHRANAQPASPEAVALQGARYFDGARMAGPATLLLQGGRVQALDPAFLPEGARRIDLAGRFVIPAMTADHAHIGNTAGAELGRRFYTRENVAAQLGRYQAFGITTVAALGMSPPLFHSLRQESQEGRLPGARFLGAGTGIGMAGGAPPEGLMRLAEDQVMRPRDAAETRAAVDRLADAGVDLIKIWVDGLNGAMPQMPPEMVRAACAWPRISTTCPRPASRWRMAWISWATASGTWRPMRKRWPACAARAPGISPPSRSTRPSIFMPRTRRCWRSRRCARP
jgi:hypothetical protein